METRLLAAALLLAVEVTRLGYASAAQPTSARAQPARVAMPYADAAPIVDRLRASVPADLAEIPQATLAASWKTWSADLDRRIRARLDRGDEDTAINFLLFGTSFTRQPRALNDSTKIGGRDRAAEIVRERIADLTEAIASPGTNERLRFVRDLVRRHGMDPATDASREQIRAYFRSLMARIVGEVDDYARTIRSARGSAELAARSTLFRTRGLSSDTSIRPDYAVDQALETLAAKGLLRSGSVQRVAILGPGLDFTDKAEGYDFYPPQTTQPFAVIDALLRLGLGKATDLRVMTFDLSPRVNGHLAAVRATAMTGTGPTLMLPHDLADRRSPGLTAFWKSFGRQIGDETTAPRAPQGVELRAVRVRPEVALAIEPHDLNVVVERLTLPTESEKLDVVVATNVLVYYSVFEQSLALANLAAMLRPGGILLSNNVLVELPTTPLRSIGHNTAVYSDRADDRDDVIWYVKK